MLKKLAVVAFIVFVLLNLLPYDYAQESAQTAKTAQSEKPSNPIPSVAAQNAHGQDFQQRPSSHESENNPRSIRVLSLPPKDKYDYIAFGANIALAIVGLIGIGVGVATVLFIKRQAIEMRHQRILMRQSLNAMRRQSRLMESQTGILKASVAAAEASAKAANDTVELAIKGQRSHIRVELHDLDVSQRKTITDRVSCKVVFYGPTVAFIVDSGAEATLTDSNAPPDDFYFGGLHLPKIIAPGTAPIELETYFYQVFSEGEIDEIKAGKSFVHFRGFIKYKDVFERERWTKFSYIWTIYSSPLPISRWGFWSKCGKLEDNQET